MDGIHDKVMASPSSTVTDENDLVRLKTKPNLKKKLLRIHLIVIAFSTLKS